MNQYSLWRGIHPIIHTAFGMESVPLNSPPKCFTCFLFIPFHDAFPLRSQLRPGAPSGLPSRPLRDALDDVHSAGRPPPAAEAPRKSVGMSFVAVLDHPNHRVGVHRTQGMGDVCCSYLFFQWLDFTVGTPVAHYGNIYAPPPPSHSAD